MEMKNKKWGVMEKKREETIEEKVSLVQEK